MRDGQQGWLAAALQRLNRFQASNRFYAANRGARARAEDRVRAAVHVRAETAGQGAAGLLKVEQLHALARAVYYGQRGRARSRWPAARRTRPGVGLQGFPGGRPPTVVGDRTVASWSAIARCCSFSGPPAVLRRPTVPGPLFKALGDEERA